VTIGKGLGYYEYDYRDSSPWDKFLMSYKWNEEKAGNYRYDGYEWKYSPK